MHILPLLLITPANICSINFNNYILIQFLFCSTRSLSPLRKQIIVETAADAEFTSNGRGRNLTIGGIEDLNDNENPPALPPKRQRINSRTASVITTPPSSPKLVLSHGTHQPQEQHQHHHHHQPQSQQLNENNCSSQPNVDDGRMKTNHSFMVNVGVGDGGGGGESVLNAAPTGTHNDSYIQLYDCSVVGKQTPLGLTGHSTNIVEDEEVEVVLRHNPNSKQVDTKFALLYVCVYVCVCDSMSVW